MTKQTINIGSAANDGTGDPIRDAFDKVNQNFDEVYSAYVANTSVTVGNSTVNTVISNTGLTSSNSTTTTVATLANFKIGNSTANSTLSGSQLSVAGNSTVGSASVNTSAMTLGNSTVNTSLSVLTLQIANSTSNITANAGNLFIGNSSVNTTVNSSVITVSSANVTSNTLTLGASTTAANGFTYLPNGFKLNWGSTSANSSTGQAVFSNAFSTAVYSVTISGNSVADLTRLPAVTTQNTTVAEIRTSNASLTKVFYMAIGV